MDKFTWYHNKAQWCWEKGLDQFALETTPEEFSKHYDMKFPSEKKEGVIASYKLFGVQFTFLEKAH